MMPFMTGIFRSVRIRSGFVLASNSISSSPLLAAPITLISESDSMILRRPSITISWSSHRITLITSDSESHLDGCPMLGFCFQIKYSAGVGYAFAHTFNAQAIFAFDHLPVESAAIIGDL